MVESLISIPYVVVLDGVSKSPRTFVEPISRKALNNLLSKPESSPALTTVTDDTFRFIDAGLQILEQI